LLRVVAHPASLQDRDGALLVLSKLWGEFPRLQVIWADGGYAGELLLWVLQHLCCFMVIIKRPKDAKGFVLLPRRWAVERAFAWLGRCRRLSKDYEELPAVSESLIYVAMTRLMVKRLTQKSHKY
jgi:putative transposase